MSRSKQKKGLAKVYCTHSSAVGVDVHAHVLVCCFQRYIPESGELLEDFAEFKTVGDDVFDFVEWCLERGPDVILMESTGVYWLSPYAALEDAGLDQSRIAVVKASQVKGAKGRKTDKADATRLAEYARMGDYTPSYIPPADFRSARLIGRAYHKAMQDLAAATNRLHKTFSAMGCRLSLVFSDIGGKTAGEIIDAYLNGSPEAFEHTVRSSRKLKASVDEIIKAFRLEVSPESKEFLRTLSDEVERRRQYAGMLFKQLENALAPYAHLMDLLKSIPGVRQVSAAKILSELGPNLDAFPTSRHFCSWIGICPGNNESAGKRSSGRIPKGNAHLKKYLAEVGQAIGRMTIRETEVRKFFQSIKERRGYKRAVIAVAHKLARIIYALFRDDRVYEEVTDYTLLKGRRKRLERAARGLKELGENVVVSTGAAETDAADNAGDRGKVTPIIAADNTGDRGKAMRNMAAGRQSEDPVSKIA